MKAYTHQEYGTPDVFSLEEVTTPTPQADEILVQVKATSINFADRAGLTGSPKIVRLFMGISKPKFEILGGDVAGVVTAVGENVTQFAVGDDVFGDLSNAGFGAFAEYVAAPAKWFAPMPHNLSYEQAAATPLAGITALQGVRDNMSIRNNDSVLINGASGGVGIFALQLAKSYGAEVTAVVSTRNVSLAEEIGADHIIDYKKQAFTTLPERYDWVIGANGHQTLGEYKRILKPDGTYVCFGGTMRQVFASMILGSFYSIGSDKTLKNMGSALSNPDDLLALKDLLEAETIVPVIDRCFSFSDLPDAFRYVIDQHARAKVVISMDA